ncbi:MAG: hypothetical protein AAF429_09780 [Pseudomonadota bacterium]
MSPQEQALADDKMRAEIARLFSEARRYDTEDRYLDDKLRAEVSKLVAEAGQIKMNTILAPALAAAGLMGATAAIVKIFF